MTSFSWFSSVTMGKCRDKTVNWAATASSHILINALTNAILDSVAKKKINAIRKD